MLEPFILPQSPPEGTQEAVSPDIHVMEATEDYARVAVEPLAPGFANTIGNPLRRILLSSIKGSAITWVKIENVVHEYAAIPGVKEEVMDLLLNIKRIRIRSQSDRTGKMRLEVAGEGRICAGDIATSADFEIVNPELHLATLDSADASLSIEFNVESGIGYQSVIPSESNAAGLPVGVLPVDAIFNPVKKVNYFREATRVGQKIDYDRLVLELWTDGTTAPLDALGEAATTLVDDFFLFKNLSGSGDVAAGRPSLSLSPEIYQTPIERLELSPRTLNCLKRAKITRVGEVLEMSDDELLKIRNFGEKSLGELREKMAERGVGGVASRANQPAFVAANLDFPAGSEPEAEPEAEDDDLDVTPQPRTSTPSVSLADAFQGVSIPPVSAGAVADEGFDEGPDYDDDDDEEDC